MEVVITENWYDPDGHMNDDWFENPLDKMPLATNGKSFDWEDTAPSEYEPPHEEPPRPEEDVCDWFTDNPDESDEIEKEKTMHQKMYEIATAKYNPFAVGGSESLGGGSEEQQSRG